MLSGGWQIFSILTTRQESKLRMHSRIGLLTGMIHICIILEITIITDNNGIMTC